MHIETDKGGEYFKAINKMYELFCTADFPQQVKIPAGFEGLIECLYEYHNKQKPQITLYELPKTEPKLNERVMVGFSGGLDSAYLALYLQDKGYRPILFHCKGLNKSYPKKDESARRFAKVAGLEYIEAEIKHSKEYYIDNPLKNQLIMSLMFDEGIKCSVGAYAMGADWCTTLKESAVGMTVTDAVETNKLFIDGISKYYPAKIIFIDNNVKKVKRLSYITEKHSDCLNSVYSCITPNRFNAHLKKKNEEKYGVKLLDGRCGSCFKCCMEYILLTQIGYYTSNKAFLDHCWEVLAQSQNSHRKDLFDKRLPLDIRYRNILNYGS